MDRSILFPDFRKIFFQLISPDLYLILLIIFLPVQLGYHFWPDYSRIFGLRIDYLSPTIYVTDLIWASLFISFLIKTKLRKNKIKETTQALNDKSLRFLLILAILNLTFAHNWQISFYQWIRVGQLLFLAWYISQNQSKTIQIIKKVFPYQVIFLSLLAIIQFLKQSSLNGLFWWFGERTFTISTPGIAKTSICQILPIINQWNNINCPIFLRPYSTFSHPNSLAGYLLVCLILLYSFSSKFHFATFGKLLIDNWLFKASVALGTLALFLTFSRSAWLALLTVILSYRLAKKDPVGFKSKLFQQFVFFLIILSIFLPFLSLFVPWFHHLNLSNTLSIRIQLFHFSWQMIKDYWVFGVGLGNFIPVLNNYLAFPHPELLQPVHNIFWLITSETGIVGLIITLWFLKTKILAAKSYLIPNTKYLILAAILITATTDHYWLTLGQNRLLLTVVIGLII